jgi:hypothetical protein
MFYDASLRCFVSFLFVLRDLRFLRRWSFMSCYSYLWHRVVTLYDTIVSENHAASIHRVEILPYHYISSIYPVDGGSIVLRGGGILLRHYMALQQRRRRLESSSTWKPQISHFMTWITLSVAHRLESLRLCLSVNLVVFRMYPISSIKVMPTILTWTKSIAVLWADNVALNLLVPYFFSGCL